ncbi:hypothetical protein E2P86_10360 [Sphingobacterium psychroaquaticum]|nr:hypothetical protein E2P86_10360 [Sphingobacterium psychroaquaticum]
MSPGIIKADTYPEVIFDNSLVSGVYAKSQVQYEGSSWVENLNKHLLVSDTLFFTPGNSLSLRYRSAAEGQWRVDLRYSRQKFNYQVDNSDFLILKIYIDSENTKKKDLPKIAITQKASQTTLLDLSSYIEDFDYNMWLNVKIPISSFKNLYFDEAITAISLFQNQVSDANHHIFIDQVEFLPKNSSNVKLTSPAILSSIKAFDRQVRLQWQLPLTPSIRYIKIYRSEDNKDFKPVAIRPIFMQSCLDYVDDLNKTYYYKIAWVDFNYLESPFSEVREVKTTKMNQEELLDLVQTAHINYFVENYDINSGMYVPFRSKDKAVVSVKESGNSVLSLLVGIEKNVINRQVALNRISRMVYFLMKGQNRYGFFPAYFDGRSGLPEYRSGQQASYDVLATSSMIEALLVARQYFSKDNELELDLRNRITKLWESVQWDKAVAIGTTDVLVERLSAVDTLNKYPSLGGINESINAYMLGMGAPKYKLPVSAYENGVKMAPIDRGAMHGIFQDSTIALPGILPVPAFILQQDSLSAKLSQRVSIFKDTLLYGERLIFGYQKGSLLNVYKPFFTINPQILRDPAIQYEEAIRSYIKVRKRRDNETGVGSTNSDIWGFYQFNDSIGTYRINPAIGPSSIFLMPEEGKRSLLALYENFGDNFFTEYGFRAWLDLRNNDVSDEYFATNQASLAVMIENARSGLIWRLYAEIPEMKKLRAELFPEEGKGN